MSTKNSVSSRISNLVGLGFDLRHHGLQRSEPHGVPVVWPCVLLCFVHRTILQANLGIKNP